jgi:hypothetical protein
MNQTLLVAIVQIGIVLKGEVAMRQLGLRIASQ